MIVELYWINGDMVMHGSRMNGLKWLCNLFLYVRRDLDPVYNIKPWRVWSSISISGDTQ